MPCKVYLLYKLSNSTFPPNSTLKFAQKGSPRNYATKYNLDFFPKRHSKISSSNIKFKKLFIVYRGNFISRKRKDDV